MRVQERSVDVGAVSTSVGDLYRLYADEARHQARAITRNDADAADAVAEAFAGLLTAQSTGRLNAAESVRPYVMAATRNAAFDIVRRTGRLRPTGEAEVLDRRATATGPSDRVVARENRDLVARAFADLPPRWRAVLWLTEVEGLPPREVAGLLDATPNNVAQLAARARSRLRERYVQIHVRNHATGDCVEAAEHLGGLVAGELTTAQANRVRGHLAECAGCRSRLAELDDVGLALRRAVAPLPVAAALRRLWSRLPFWGRGRGRRIAASTAQIGPSTVDAGAAVTQIAGSPAIQQAAAAVVAGLLVIGVGTAAVRQHDEPPRPDQAPALQADATTPSLPAVATTVAPIAGPAAEPATTTTSAVATTVPATIPPAVAPASPPFTPRGPLPAASPSQVAQPLASQLPVFAAPGATVASQVLANPRRSGAPLVLLVVGEQPGWLQVLLPVRPNGSTGWIRADQVRLASNPFRVVVELGAHRLTAYQGTEVVLSQPIGVGTAEAPTPGGHYYVTELFQGLDSAGRLDPDGPYGPYAFGLSGFSDVLYDFAGGDGQFGIHGTNDPAGLGHDVSHGCIRVSNAAITTLAGILPLGTPVDILP